MLAGKITNK